jgi:ABC-2 type transport system permease protein
MFHLQLRNELWKLFAKKRTYMGFLMFLLAQNAVILLFRFAPGPRQGLNRLLELNGYIASHYLSALTVATFILLPVVYLLLPLYAALVGGDLVAKEAEDGTLRMILSRPISRFRLLGLKWLAGVMFSGVLSIALAGFGLLFASLWFPWGGLFVYEPGSLFGLFEPGEGLQAYLIAHVFVVAKAITILGLAFMFSCFNVKPAAATILALSFVFANAILQNIPFFRDLQPWFLTYHLNVWQLLFAQPVPWWRVGSSLSILAGYNLTFFVVGLVVFQMRDIKS